MKYKALMLDVDGTLSPHEFGKPALPTKKVTQAIHMATKKLAVGLATSRSLPHLIKLIKNLKLNGYSIIYNGAQIINSKTLKTVYKQALSPGSVPKVYRIVKEYATYASYSDFSGRRKVRSLKQLLEKPIAGIYCNGIKPSKIEKVEDELSQINNISIHKFHTLIHGTHELSISHIKATKQYAIAQVAKLLKIQPSKIIAVGDSYNDFPLFMACGLRIAMGNAVNELKAMADFIAPSIEEDGVATVIEKFILNS